MASPPSRITQKVQNRLGGSSAIGVFQLSLQKIHFFYYIFSLHFGPTLRIFVGRANGDIDKQIFGARREAIWLRRRIFFEYFKYGIRCNSVPKMNHVLKEGGLCSKITL